MKSDNMRETTVLLTACGVQFIPGLVDCLKNNGERNVRLIGTDMNDDKTLYPLFDKFYVVPPVKSDKYVNTLLDICKNEKVDVLLPFMSAELSALEAKKRDFETVGTKVSVSNGDSIAITNNKLKFYEFLKDKGLPVPKFKRIEKADELYEACEFVGYPQKAVCVKATELSGSRGIRLIDPKKSRYDILFGQKPNSFYTTIDELYATLKERLEMPEMMAMEYLPGAEGSVDLIADHGKILYMAYRESNINLASIPQEATLSYNEKAYRIAEEVIKALSLDGNADLDFKNDADGNPVLMEINPRIAATMQIFKVGGLNLPYLRVKQLLGEPLPEIDIKYGIKMKRRYLEMFCDNGGAR